ncbi:MAG: primosomal protein N' [Thermodesulfovibrio sp.]|nr:primosomal protein N' [Thermodesulfovibrio sp.]
MIESPMTCYDVIFPLALGPLTYRCPEHLTGSIEPGMIVTAPLRKRITQGIILRRNDNPPDSPLKEFIEPSGTIISRPLLRLIPWMADYYIASEGMVLKQTLPPELFEKTAMHRQRKAAGHVTPDLPGLTDSLLLPLLEALQEKKFSPFLFHALSTAQEYSVARAVAEKTENVIILLPEISQADLIYQSLYEILPERVCLLHSGLSKGRRSATIDGIISGKHDIVIGTRHALFAPLKKVSCIMVLQEHSSFYKMEDGIRYHMRDVAVKRGFLEKAVVLLSSVTPSVDSYYNALTDKYGFIRPEGLHPRPKISVVDMRYCKKATPAISKTAANLAGSRLGIGKNVMLLVNRKGYATLLCRECEQTVLCPDCAIAMVMHKESKLLKCHYCGRGMEIPLQCSRCRSVALDPVGSGTERVQEDIGKVLKIPAIRFDKDVITKRSDLLKILRDITDSPPNLLIGTKLLTTHLTLLHRFSLAVIMNSDASTNFPDFRASEKAFAELASILGHIDPDGDLLIQTRAPGNQLVRYFRDDNYRGFVHEELEMRKALSFPPFTRMIEITISGRTDLAEKIVKGLQKTAHAIEVLGPVVSQSRHGRRQMSVFLKSADRKALNRAARSVMDSYGTDQETQVRVDVDPA